jgi:hypothetical protein
VQRQYLPRTYLDSATLQPGQVFIDRTTKLMWEVEPTYSSSKDIMREGTFSGCALFSIPPHDPNLCRLDWRSVTGAPYLIGDRYDFRPATTAELNKLFADHTGDTLSWLKTAGVSFEGPKRFPGYDPNNLDYRVALWSRDGWWVGSRRQGTLRPMQARMAVLQYGLARPAFAPTGPLKDPEWITPEIAGQCQTVSSGTRVPARPNCAETFRKGGFILWVRPTSATERQMYCGSGWDFSPVLTLPAQSPGGKPTEVKAPSSVTQLC